MAVAKMARTIAMYGESYRNMNIWIILRGCWQHENIPKAQKSVSLPKAQNQSVLSANFPKGQACRWATKDKIVEALSEGAPLTQRAPRYPTWILVQIERLVLDEDEVVGLRVFAWAKLFKSWASLRYRAPARGGPAVHDTPSDQDFGSEPEDKGAASLC